MRPVDVVKSSTSAALLAGALVGLAELSWLSSVTPLPDLRAPVYAAVLYGGIGAVLGLGVGILALPFARRLAPGLVFALAFLAPYPMALFVVRYLANKVVFHETGVPVSWLVRAAGATLGGFVVTGAAALLLFFALGRARGAKRPSTAGPALGVWSALVIVLAALLFLPRGDETRWAGSSPEGEGVIVLFVDTLRADHVGAWGGPVATPAMDGLAADGVVFEQAFAAASWTRASGASLLTSRIPSSHDAATKSASLSPDVVTLFEVLQAGGAHTGALVDNVNLTATFGFDQGFDVFVYEAPDYPLLGSESVFALAMYKVVQKLAERVLPGPREVARFYQPADVVLADARRFVEANRGRRYALLVHLMEPHDPYFEHPSLDGDGPDYNGKAYGRAEHEHPDPADTEYLKATYRGEVAFLDRELAEFLTWMKASGDYDRTAIVLVADHGEEFSEHGGFWHGTTLYDEQLHVPLIFKLPGGRLAGARAPWQVRLIDVAPTLAVVAGMAPDPSWEGRDLLADLTAVPNPTVGGEASGSDEPPSPDVPPEPEPARDPAADAAACEAARRHPLDRVLVAEEDFEGNQLAAIRDGGFKWIRANAGNPRGLPERALYDVSTDPGEQRDALAGAGLAVCGRFPADRAEHLDRALGDAIVAARKGAVASGHATIDAAECERLKALGYVAGDEDCR